MISTAEMEYLSAAKPMGAPTQFVLRICPLTAPTTEFASSRTPVRVVWCAMWSTRTCVFARRRTRSSWRPTTCIMAIAALKHVVGLHEDRVLRLANTPKSQQHTSELQSHLILLSRLPLQKT